MKKLLSIAICIFMIFGLVACSGKEPSKNELSAPTETEPESQSQGGNPDNVDDSTVVVGGETLGNTQYMAYVIQQNTNADIFREMVKLFCNTYTEKYSLDY